MASIQKTLVVKVLNTEYALPYNVGRDFCNLLNNLNKITSPETTSANFKIVWNIASWIEVTKTGPTFQITASGGETETLTQAQMNQLIAYCRNTPTEMNCGCGM